MEDGIQDGSSDVHEDDPVYENGFISARFAYAEYTKYAAKLAEFVEADHSMHDLTTAGLSSLEDSIHSAFVKNTDIWHLATCAMCYSILC